MLDNPVRHPGADPAGTDPPRRFGRRDAAFALLALTAAALAPRRAAALSLADLTEGDAAAGLKAALRAGATAAVSLLGRADGFWGNDLVRIPLPEWLQRAEKTLRFFGRGADVDALKLGVNRAAEQAVPQAKTLLGNAVRDMSVADAKGILSGGEDSVTRFFADKTRAPLSEQFLPIVTATVNKIGLARQYNRLVDRAGQFGLAPDDGTHIENHVTVRALDGLYLMIGEEERKIRRDPAGAASAIVKKVFGALQ